MALSRLLPRRQFLHLRTHGFIRTRRWSSSPAPEHQSSSLAAARPEKRADGVNEAMSNSADAAEIQNKAENFSWPSIVSMFSKMKEIIVSKHDCNKRIDAKVVASSPMAAATKESREIEDDASNLLARPASEAVKEPESWFLQQSQPNLELCNGESKHRASPVSKEANKKDVLELNEMLDSPPPVDVTKKQKATEVIEKALPGMEDDKTNSTGEGHTVKVANGSQRTDENERCADFVRSLVTETLESKQKKVDIGAGNLPRRDVKSHQVKSKSKAGSERNEREVPGFSNEAKTRKGLLPNKMKSAKQSEEAVPVMTDFMQRLFDNRNKPADHRGKHDTIKSLLDYIMDVPLQNDQARPQDTDTISPNGKISNKGSNKLRQQLSDKEKPAVQGQRTHDMDKQKRKNGASRAGNYHLVSKPSYNFVHVDMNSLDRTCGSKLKDSAASSQIGKRLQKAMDRNPLRNSDDHIETAACADSSPQSIMIPGTTNNPDIPFALLKNPTRAVKIVQLTHDVTLHQLKESLELRAGRISSLFLGSSGSVAYAEFKSEDAKEVAIAEHSIDVAGKHLHVLRLEAPKTNIIRISNPTMISGENISSICRRYGRVQKEMRRSDVCVDVYFDLSELPNMLNILNSLNGLQVEGSRLTAVPAPAFPEEVLRVLWVQYEGRRHVKSVLRSLLQKIECNISTAELTDRLSECYAD